MARQTAREEVRELVLAKVESVLSKPRVSAHSPQSLVEIVYALLSLGFDERRFEQKLYKDIGGSKSWWLSEDLDYPTVINKLNKLVSLLVEESYQ